MDDMDAKPAEAAEAALPGTDEAARDASAAIAALQRCAALQGGKRVVKAEAVARSLRIQLEDAREALDLAKGVIEEQSGALHREVLARSQAEAQGSVALSQLEQQLWAMTAALHAIQQRSAAAETERLAADAALDVARMDVSSLLAPEVRSLGSLASSPLLALPHQPLAVLLQFLDPASANTLASSGRAAFVRLSSALAMEALPALHSMPSKLRQRYGTKPESSASVLSGSVASDGHGTPLESASLATVAGSGSPSSATASATNGSASGAGKPAREAAAGVDEDEATFAMRLAALPAHKQKPQALRRAAQWGLRPLFPVPLPGTSGHAISASGDLGAGASGSSDAGSDGGATGGSEAKSAAASALERGLGAIAAASATSGLLQGISDSGSVLMPSGASIGSVPDFAASPHLADGTGVAGARRRGLDRPGSSRAIGPLGKDAGAGPGSPRTGRAGVLAAGGGGGRGNSPAGSPSGGISMEQARGVMMRAQQLKNGNAILLKQIRAAKAETEEVRRELKVAKDVEVWLDEKVGELEAAAKKQAESMRSVLEQHEKDITVMAYLDRRATNLQKQCEAAAETILEANQRAEASVGESSQATTQLAAAEAKAASLDRRLVAAEADLARERTRLMEAEGRAEAAESAAAKAQAEAEAAGAAGGGRASAPQAIVAPGNPFAAAPEAAAATAAAPGTPGNPFAGSSPPAVDSEEVARLRTELEAANTRAREAQEAATTWNRKFMALAAHMKKLKGSR
jgi:hypothetical protein